MGIDHRPADRLLRLTERGSAILEGAVALAVAFLLLTLLIQVGFAVAARNAAEASVAAAARRAARPGAHPALEEAALSELLRSSLPGIEGLSVDVRVSPQTVEASASFLWQPPGPRWIPLAIRVAAVAPRSVPP
ncbi:MAG: hypothetical protein ACRDXD_01060 [Acidimicrobiia bacterium]